MAFFDDLINAVTGQQSAPQQTIIPTADLLNQSYATFAGAVPGYLAGQQPLATGLTDIQLGVANQLDPSILANYRGANQSILDQLNLGTNMSPELQAEITRGLLSTNAASGFGASAGGVGNILYQTAIDKQNLLRQRQQDALSAGSGGLGIAGSFYNPTNPIGVDSIAGMLDQEQAARDNLANITENIRQKNFSNFLSTGLKIAGGIAAAIPTGGAGFGLGASIGGSLIPGGGVAGFNQPQSSGFSSLLSGLSGIGGPQYGIGAGSQYPGANNQVMTSVKAAPFVFPGEQGSPFFNP